MHPTEIESILRAALALDELYVQGENGHFQVIAVSPLFAGMSRVKKQQTIYAPLAEHIASNAIHALSIKAFTPEEWQRDRKLNGF
ncbi:MAG: BolA family transcriptional regulator [Gammaproteobacteria bacterium]|uniref:Acid stress-induced BolA-like protein IbaG/YrbA n=1 Tax=Tolumonas osonensis TaxID=675874 RepID=A0A841GPF8_9GAMM|nr:BolA family iron metabolism protein IbaG [Tolumonas osonensis]MBB6056750.1 acid stress-induced BolA-like protein IbaG/YrbA [Tolumonas osonensis]NCB61692.1 BolA family transcriptional regulator [Gammaproteobacteria bacterium]